MTELVFRFSQLYFWTMEPPSKRSRKLEAKANAEASALCVQAPTIDGAILAPDDIQWLETALTKFSDGIADTDVSANTDHHVCQWHHKAYVGRIAGCASIARRSVIRMVVALHTLPGNAYQHTALGLSKNWRRAWRRRQEARRPVP